MSYAAEAASIRQRWASAMGAVSTAYENAPFSPPDGTWVRLTVLGSMAFQADMAPEGQRRFRHPGTIIVQVFAPHSTGDGAARTLADEAAAVFRGQSFGGLVCKAASVIPMGSDGTWYQVNVTVEFYRDTTY